MLIIKHLLIYPTVLMFSVRGMSCSCIQFLNFIKFRDLEVNYEIYENIVPRKFGAIRYIERDRENPLVWGSLRLAPVWGSLRLAPIKYYQLNVTESGINTTI